MSIPSLFIEGWLPGTKDHDKVNVSERLGPHATAPYLFGVPLKRAKEIVATFDLMRTLAWKLKAFDAD